MALTFTNSSQGVIGNLRYWEGTITLDNSYVTGGYAVTVGNFLLASRIFFLHMNDGSGGLLVHWDYTNSKIKIYCPTGGGTAPTSLIAPVSAAGTVTFSGTATGTMATGAVAVLSNTSVASVTVPASGLSASFGAPALTGGIGIEMGSGANLSTIAIHAFVVGQ